MKYCLIGEKLSHSYSAEIHRLCQLDYSLVEIQREKLKDVISAGYDGFNVTIPYKKDIIPFLDGVDEAAEEIGAVNTVVRRDGKYFGYNTDLLGMSYALSRKGISLTDKRVMILGSGGTASTAEALCKAQNAASCIKVSRSGKIDYENCYNYVGTEIIINATPVGMFPNNGVSPIDLRRFPVLKGVFDCVYNPFKTELIMQAEALGIACSNGLAMLVHQAIAAQKIWGVGGANAEEIIDYLYKKHLNVVLCGMPSAGKTSVGKLVAETLGKTFVDTDAAIYRKTGKTPSAIIEESGEKVFRDVETEIICDTAKRGGQVIATGGGAVLRGENERALKQNGIVCYVKRDLALLSAVNRPLSQAAGIGKLFEERKALYERAADIYADNNGKIEACAEEIALKFKNFKFDPIKG